ncbi:MAG: LacI family DNA-binding transcriptional regulator [Lachnospiraceae bacterium]
MSITFKQLAEICGVSRATVDRVIHNRGKVAPEVEQRIRKAAEQYGFQPNQVGKALARAANPVKIGVLVHLSWIDFFQELLAGIYAGQKEVHALGGEVIIKEQRDFDAEGQIRLLDEMLAEGVNGIALPPAQSGRLCDRLNELSRSGIQIVTYNTELEGLNKLCHVGADNVQGGRISAFLMDLLLRGKGGKVLLISGHRTQQSNYQREEGFRMECASCFPNIEVAAVKMNADEEKKAYDITMEAIREIPDLEGIYMISNGVEGLGRALEDSGKAGKIQVVACDLVPVVRKYMEKGVIQFVIDQDTLSQGSMPSKILFDYLFSNKKPTSDRIIGQFVIKTQYNM